MNECGSDRLAKVEAEPYGYGPFEKKRTVQDPCPGLFRDACTGTEVAVWGIKLDELAQERDDLLSELAELGCVWPNDLNESIASTDGYRLRYVEEWGFFGSGLNNLYTSLFGVVIPAGEITFTNIVQIQLEIIARITCELERLDLLNVAQDCGAIRPDPTVPIKRSWTPVLLAAGVGAALWAGFRFGRALK